MSLSLPQDVVEQRFADLQDRLASLQDAETQLRALISRLAGQKDPNRSDDNGEEEEEQVDAELSNEINQALRDQEEELELVEEEATDARPPRRRVVGSESVGEGGAYEKQRLREGITRLKGDLHGCRVAFRKAQMEAKRNLEQTRRRDHQLLLASLVAPPVSDSVSPTQPQTQSQAPKSGAKSKGDQAISAGMDVTLSLRRTHALMASELARSEFAHKTLLESSAQLSGVADSYALVDDMLARSRALLGTLLRSQKSDTWYLETTYWMLLTTIVWLAFRRFLYGPAWWFVWLPLKLTLKGVIGVSGAVGLFGGRDGVEPSDLVADLEAAGPATPVMNNEDVPTIRVGRGIPVSSGEAVKDAVPEPGAESMLEEVGHIMDEANERDAAYDTTKGSEMGVDEPVLEERGRDPQEAARVKDEL